MSRLSAKIVRSILVKFDLELIPNLDRKKKFAKFFTWISFYTIGDYETHQQVLVIFHIVKRETILAVWYFHVHCQFNSGKINMHSYLKYEILPCENCWYPRWKKQNKRLKTFLVNQCVQNVPRKKGFA
jgi:hypothetical protein